MKKIILGLISGFVFSSLVSAQVLPSTGVQNNLWTAFGSSVDGKTRFYGFIDTLQARVDIKQFTIEGMLNWGAIANWGNDSLNSFTFANTNLSPLAVHYYGIQNENGAVIPVYQDPSYVNFLWKPFDYLQVGIGTKLNWMIGPAPTNGATLWEPSAHVCQGGLRGTSTEGLTYAVPGSADVVGFVPYGNVYAKRAFGTRFFYEGSDVDFQLGIAIPDGVNSSGPEANIGGQIAFGKFAISASYIGLFQKDGNFYAGVTMGASDFTIDGYFAWNSIDSDTGNNARKDMSYSFGAAILFKFPKVSMSLRPEASINWFEDTDYTPAWYIGATYKWDIADAMTLSAYSSFAVGSADLKWKESSIEAVRAYTGGNVFTIRPEFTFHFTKRHSVTGFINIESRVSYDNIARGLWSSGAFWTYKLY